MWRDLAWIYLQWSVCCWFCEALILPRCPAGENDLDPSDGWDLEFYLEAWSLWGREVFRGAERLNMIEPGCSPPRNPSFRRGATLSWTLQCQSCNFRSRRKVRVLRSCASVSTNIAAIKMTERIKHLKDPEIPTYGTVEASGRKMQVTWFPLHMHSNPKSEQKCQTWYYCLCEFHLLIRDSKDKS